MTARLLVVLAVLPRALGAAARAPRTAGPAPVPAGPAPVPAGPAPVAAGPAPMPAGPAPVPAGPAPVAAAPVAPSASVEGDEIPPAARGVRLARGILVALGVVLVGVGLGALVAGVPLGQWPAIGIWLAVALVLHDGLLAPLLIVGARLLRRGSARLPWGALAVVQGAVVVGGAVTLLAFPALQAQRIGARNPSVLIFDYGAHLAIAWAVLGAVAAAAIVLGAVRRARR